MAADPAAADKQRGQAYSQSTAARAVSLASSFEAKPVASWTLDDCQAWASQLPYGEELKKEMAAQLAEWGVDGAFLLELDQEVLAGEWGLSPEVAEDVQFLVQQAQDVFRGHAEGLAGVTFSTAIPDVFTLDDEGPPRAQMPCGHGVSQPSMLHYLRSEMGKMDTTDLPCPDAACMKRRVKWPYDLCASVARLTVEERMRYDALFVSRSAECDVRECPHAGCGSFIQKPANINQLRVRCTQCSNRDFCWRCLSSWTGGGLNECSNPGCTVGFRNKTLAECATKTISGVADVPAIRACPKCDLLIEHLTACKHMTCPCKHEFCFACLREYKLCPHYEKCYVAGRQKFE